MSAPSYSFKSFQKYSYRNLAESYSIMLLVVLVAMIFTAQFTSKQYVFLIVLFTIAVAWVLTVRAGGKLVRCEQYFTDDPCIEEGFQETYVDVVLLHRDQVIHFGSELELKPFLDAHFGGRTDVAVRELWPFMKSSSEDGRGVIAVVSSQLVDRGLLEPHWNMLVLLDQSLAVSDEPD